MVAVLEGPPLLLNEAQEVDDRTSRWRTLRLVLWAVDLKEVLI